ncbi:MAG: thymidylate kinase [Neolewinella sp.]|jgi:thymidylate kinase
MYVLLEGLDGAGELTFTKTTDSGQRQASSFKVTLGVTPNFACSGEGIRLEAVLEPGKKPDWNMVT